MSLKFAEKLGPEGQFGPMNLRQLIKANYAQVFFVFAAFFLMVLVSYLSVGSIVQRQLILGLDEALLTAEANVRAGFSDTEALMINAARNVREMMGEDASQREILAYLTKTTEWINRRETGGVRILGIYAYLRGEFIDGIGLNLPPGYTPQIMPWFDLAVRNLGEKTVYTEPYVDVRTGDVILSAVHNIYGESGDYLGVLVIDMDMSWFKDFSLSYKSSDGGYGVVLNQYMVVMGHPRVVTRHLRGVCEGYQKIHDALILRQEISAMSIIDVDGKAAIASFRQMSNGWYVGVIVPRGSYYRNVYQTAAVLSALGFVLMIILSGILLRLSAARMRSEEENRSKSTFLAQMSHEIRTPMNAIIGIAQIQLLKEDLPDEYAEAMGKISNSGNSLLRIINDILDLSKIETGKLELNPMEYDAPSLIYDTVQLNIVRISSKPVEFILEIDENLPLRLYGDELRLKQILSNLLSNAIKYTERGKVKLSVKHWPEGGDIMLSFSVEDTGQGMTPEDRQRLFSEYQRFNTAANRTTEGTGLGLSIAKKLVEMMGGTIQVESEYGKGSIFTVTIRQKAVECAPIGAELAKQLCGFTFIGERQIKEAPITREPMPYGKVLVVDDVETNLYVANGILSFYKLNIETANSGYAALDKVNSGHTYDVIFMDHMMPQMDGMETTQKLRKLGYTKPIVALTANALIGSDEMFAQEGFDGFIPKPIDARLLNQVLNRFVRDRYPEEAEKYKPEITTQAERPAIDPKVLQAFRGDAEKAIDTLRKTAVTGDMKLFTITAHAMKSALANVGEPVASALAAKLESAGHNGDTGYISANFESFINTLEILTGRLGPKENSGAGLANAVEDEAYLIEQLKIIKAACEGYDDDTAYAALDRLKEQAWKPETTGALEQIRDALFIYSDFEGAAEQSAALINDRRRE